MTVRTFKQLGQGYATEPLTIIASIDNVIVYEGIIPTVDQNGSTDPGTIPDIFGEQLFTWELDTAFSGTVDMSVTVAGPGRLFLTSTLANYVQILAPDSVIEPRYYINSGPDVFGFFYQKQMEDYVLGDPMTNVKISGVPQTTSHGPLASGQWNWFIEGGDTFSATVNIGGSPMAPAVPR